MVQTLRVWLFLFFTAALLIPRAAVACVGDCDGDARVSIDELITAVQITLGGSEIASCDAIDNNRDGAVTINELVRGVAKGLGGCAAGPAGETLIWVGASEVDEFELGTGAGTQAIPNTLLNGQACLLPGGSGNYVVGGPATTHPGFSVFSPDGTFLQQIGLEAPSEPFGCAVDAQGRLFGTAVRPDGGDLLVFFPPDYTRTCVLDQDLRHPGTLALDDAGNLYLPEGSAPGAVLRFAGPFPGNPAECGSVQPTRSTFIEYLDSVPSIGIARGSNGHWFVAQARRAGESQPGIREHDADGTFIRELLPPGSGGDPQGLAFDSAGNLYYADLGVDENGAAIQGKATLRKIAFDQDGDPADPELVARGLSFPRGVSVFPSRADEWLTLGGSIRRTYFNPRERVLNAGTATQLIPKWKYQTSGMVSAQPVVTWIDLPGEGRTQIVIVPSWDRYVYALRTENGSLVWRYQMKPQPGTFYPYSGSATLAWVDGQQRVYVPGGETMYCLDAATGAELWQFDAGTGCTTCTARQERNEIESSAAVVDGLVLLGMDTNDGVPGKGAVFALRADDGRLVWWFDVVTQATCRPFDTDDIRSFDGFHTAVELGLPEGFLQTRPGCDFDRTSIGCGNVWSSMAVDMRRRQLYTVSSNCDVDDDPETPPPPVTPPLEEAIFSLTLGGELAWVWRPREVDPDDLDFGAVPNLFEAEIGGAVREVVGVGGKDGTYYVLDRDGTNEISGAIEPYWRTNVVPGGAIGGIIGAASVGEGQVIFETAFGLDIANPQKPAVHALDARDGSILWQNSEVDTGFAPASGVPGLVLLGGTPRPNLNVFARDTGELLKSVLAAQVPSGIASAATIVGGEVFVGAGTGALNEGPDALREATRDTPVAALCVQGTPGCATNSCNDNDPCTYDYRNREGACVSEPGAEGVDCRAGAAVGQCAAGVCVATPG